MKSNKKKGTKKKQSNPSKKQALLFLRYLLILVIGLISAFTTWFYEFLLILTIHPVNFLLNLGYSTVLVGNTITIGTDIIEIIPACVAVSAYFLLLILNLTTPMGLKTRFKSLLFSLLALLIVNILRIHLLSLMFLNNAASFEIIHKLFWYILSTVFVVAIWFITVYLFKIKEIPAYSDIKYLLKTIKK